MSAVREASCGRCAAQAPALGCEVGLTNREAKILGDIVRGFGNSEIAFRQSVTINTVKTYIRSAYRKIGATSRAQAVSWGLQHGFDPNTQSEDIPASHNRAVPSLRGSP